jgi:hypothetical protein
MPQGNLLLSWMQTYLTMYKPSPLTFFCSEYFSFELANFFSTLNSQSTCQALLGKNLVFAGIRVIDFFQSN